jgi:hypothetical protein
MPSAAARALAIGLRFALQRAGCRGAHLACAAQIPASMADDCRGPRPQTNAGINGVHASGGSHVDARNIIDNSYNKQSIVTQYIIFLNESIPDPMKALQLQHRHSTLIPVRLPGLASLPSSHLLIEHSRKFCDTVRERQLKR